jgi:hypothetical protein
MTTTRADFDRRLSRLERVHTKLRANQSWEWDMSPETVRKVFEAVWEAGGFYKPPVGSDTWQFRERLKAELGLTDEDFLPEPYDSAKYWEGAQAKTQQHEPQQDEPIRRAVPA